MNETAFTNAEFMASRSFGRKSLKNTSPSNAKTVGISTFSPWYKLLTLNAYCKLTAGSMVCFPNAERRLTNKSFADLILPAFSPQTCALTKAATTLSSR